ADRAATTGRARAGPGTAARRPPGRNQSSGRAGAAPVPRTAGGPTRPRASEDDRERPTHARPSLEAQVPTAPGQLTQLRKNLGGTLENQDRRPSLGCVEVEVTGSY